MDATQVGPKTMRAIQDQLESGERYEVSLPASRTVDLTAAGGRLCVTDRRLLFVPRGFNVKGRSPWSASWGEICGIEVAKRTWQPYNGGMRRRLLVHCTDGSQQYFVVNKVDVVAEHLRIRVSGRHADNDEA